MTRVEFAPGCFRDTPNESTAWDAYPAHIMRVTDDPSLENDPEFVATRERLHGDFRRVFG
jgi:hypothetical protein